jgi:hypothetical protein
MLSTCPLTWAKTAVGINNRSSPVAIKRIAVDGKSEPQGRQVDAWIPDMGG